MVCFRQATIDDLLAMQACNLTKYYADGEDAFDMHKPLRQPQAKKHHHHHHGPGGCCSHDAPPTAACSSPPSSNSPEKKADT